MRTIQQTAFLALLAVATAIACDAAIAGDGVPACPYVSSIQRRIVEHADQGMDSLRGYVWGTERTFGINMDDVRNNLDSWRAAVQCRKELARAESKIDVAIQAGTKAR